MIATWQGSVLMLLVLTCASCAPPVGPTNPPSRSTTSEADNADAAEPTQPAETERVAAAAGVGKKGRSLDQFEDDPVQNMVARPAIEYFRAKERIVFEIAIPYNLNLYKATHGHAPKTHEDFMREIIDEYDVELPELPAGSRYVYDPETEQLMVERPVSKP